MYFFVFYLYHWKLLLSNHFLLWNSEYEEEREETETEQALKNAKKNQFVHYCTIITDSEIIYLLYC